MMSVTLISSLSYSESGETSMNTAGFVFGAIISTIIMLGTVMAAHANAVSFVSVPGAWIL
jgi:hypothetical protein